MLSTGFTACLRISCCGNVCPVRSGIRLHAWLHIAERVEALKTKTGHIEACPELLNRLSLWPVGSPMAIVRACSVCRQTEWIPNSDPLIVCRSDSELSTTASTTRSTITELLSRSKEKLPFPFSRLQIHHIVTERPVPSSDRQTSDIFPRGKT